MKPHTINLNIPSTFVTFALLFSVLLGSEQAVAQQRDTHSKGGSVVDSLTVPEVLLARGAFYKEGRPFWLKGVGYSPYRPGCLPKSQNIGEPDVLREDMKRIKAAGFNTLRTWSDMPDYVYELAAEEGLYVLTGLWVPLGNLNHSTVWRRAAQVTRKTVNRLKKHPNIIGYLIFNEPEPALFDEAEPENVQAFFDAVLSAAHEADPFRPCAASPWIVMWFVDMSAWDMLCYNIYNYFPSAVRDNFGYARFIDYTRSVQAENRPFVVTEFGYPVNPTGDGGLAYGGNSLEEQADGVVDVIDWIVAGGAQGACVFEWNDEWWKAGNIVDDQKTHDDDPEEYFGMLSFENDQDTIGTLRPVYYAVRDAYDCLVLSPRQDSVYTGDVRIAVYQDQPARASGYEYALDGGEWIPLTQQHEWAEHTLRHADLSKGMHEVLVRMTNLEGVIQDDLTRTIRFCVADAHDSPEQQLKLDIGPEDRAIEEPLKVTLRVVDKAGEPVLGHAVELSLLNSQPVRDVYYKGTTDSNGLFSVSYIPTRGIPKGHLNIWGSSETLLNKHTVYEGVDASVIVKGAKVPDPSVYERIIRRAETAPVIDGVLDDCWGAEPMVDLSWPPDRSPDCMILGAWLGNDDLSASIHALWDDQSLYFLVNVTDPTPAQNTWSDSDVWRGDGIEVYLGTDAESDAGNGYAPTDYQFILAPKEKTWVYDQARGGTRNAPLQDVELVTVLTERGYVMEARIPWVNFMVKPLDGKRLRLDFVLNGTKAEQDMPTKLIWASSGDGYISSRNWGRAVLSEEPIR